MRKICPRTGFSLDSQLDLCCHQLKPICWLFLCEFADFLTFPVTQRLEAHTHTTAKPEWHTCVCASVPQDGGALSNTFRTLIGEISHDSSLIPRFLAIWGVCTAVTQQRGADKGGAPPADGKTRRKQLTSNEPFTTVKRIWQFRWLLGGAKCGRQRELGKRTIGRFNTGKYQKYHFGWEPNPRCKSWLHIFSRDAPQERVFARIGGCPCTIGAVWP